MEENLDINYKKGKISISEQHSTTIEEPKHITKRKNNIKIPPETQKEAQTIAAQLYDSLNIKTNEVKSKKKDEVNKNNINTNDYIKRKGTASLSGQLYKTKLLSLVLLRSLYNENITDFLLGTNMEGLGEFDDIIYRYDTDDHEMQNSKIIFLQAKHKDDVTRALTIEDLLKQQGDFAIPKYFESYLKIKQIFVTENDNVMFRGDISNFDYDFIIYTPVVENLPKDKLIYCLDETYMKTSKQGKMFQLQWESKDIEILMHCVARSRAVKLAKSLSKFILNDNNFSNMMLDDLMKTYHVFLAQNIIIIEDVTAINTFDVLISRRGKVPYFLAKFRDSFFTSNDCYILLIKNVICKEIAENKGIMSINWQYETEAIMKSFVFKLPVMFGNQYFCISGSEKDLNYFCLIIQKLLDTCHYISSEYYVVKLNDSSVGPDQILLRKDLETLGGLIGNLLILDDETEMLKFNVDEQCLSSDNIKILEILLNREQNYDLSRYRFDININVFPRLSLKCGTYCRDLMMEFLTKLKFYTNQARENEVEDILKEEIDRYCNIQQRQHESIVRVRCDAIFLKVHDKIQNWWLQPNSAPYLTKSCMFYHQAETDILDSPLLNIIHFIYCENIKNYNVKFENEAVDSLGLKRLFKSSEKVMVIVSDEPTLSCIKAIQYLDKVTSKDNYIIIDIDSSIIINCLEGIKSELCRLKILTLIVVAHRCTDIDSLHIKLINVKEQFTGKVIIIADSVLEDCLKSNTRFTDTIFCRDNKNNFTSLTKDTQNTILQERKVIFQGIEVVINTVLDNTALNLLSLDLLCKIIMKEDIEVGKSLMTSFYHASRNYYVSRTTSRWVRLEGSVKTDSDFYIIEDGVHTLTRSTQATNDIIVLTEREDVFNRFCRVYRKNNVHWCIQDKFGITWQRSRGSLKNIIKYVRRGSSAHGNLQLETIMDIEERIVIISSEPGEGKSTLLTHLAVNTKRTHPDHWILKLRLLEHIDQFSKWKENKTKIDFAEVMYFLYRTLDFGYNEVRSLNLISTNNTNEVYLNNNDVKICRDMWQIKLFNYFYNSNRLVILIDGFDEICPDYSNEVILLLDTLKVSKVARLWVTTRPYHVLEQLELALDTFSFHLFSFTEIEQEIFLLNMWSTTLDHDRTFNTNEIRWYVNKFLAIIASLLFDNDHTFTSSPLHLHMAAEMYQNIFKDFVMTRNTRNTQNNELSETFEKNIKSASNLTSLYEQFTHMKFYKIRFAEKNQSMNLKHPDTKRMIQKEYKEFVDYHQKAAAYVLLKRNIVLSDNELSDIYEFFDIIQSGEEKTGIVECIFDNAPFFSHFTFAEYFAVEFIFHKLKYGSYTLWHYLIKDVMVNNDGIQRFINSKLQNDSIMTELMTNKEHMSIVCQILLKNSKEYFTALYVAINHLHECNAIFLLHCVKTTLRKENLLTYIELINMKYDKYCILCAAVAKGAHSTVASLIELVADVESDKLINLFYCQDPSKCNPMLVIRDEKVADLLFDVLRNKPDTMLSLFTFDLQLSQLETVYTIVNRFQKYCLNYLLSYLSVEQRLQIFNVKYLNGQLSVHYAAKANDYDFFLAMDQLVGREEFKRMCMSVDDSGFTPVSNFSYDQDSFDKFKMLLEMIYEDIDIDVVKTKFRELRGENFVL